MDGQAYLIQLVIGWTCAAVFVSTAIITMLTLVGLVQVDPVTRNRLFSILVFEVVIVGVGVFAGLMRLNPAPLVSQLQAGADAQSALEQIETSQTAELTPPAVAPAQTELTPRVYIHIADDAQLASAREAAAALRGSGQLVPSIENVGARSPSITQLRYFSADESQLANVIAQTLQAAGVPAEAQLIPGFENANVRQHHFELWFEKT